MALADKYKELVDLAQQYGASVSDEGNVLRVNGEVPSAALKDKMWEIYDRIDPNFKSNDLVLDVNVQAADGSKVKVVTRESNLNIRKGPGTDQPIVGKAAHGDTITLISKYNDQWWYVRDNDGEEGYSYAQYLEPVQ
ncbi:SH3 domain-containing protein [Petrimonas sp.]|uniref:SH3 domain-containing protein n=1 Tax=Petrimonas sp. TaxID=2023866 RepID=UPI003F519ED0